MLLQVVQRLRRTAALQVVRRGHQQQRGVFQLSRYQPAVRQLAQADGQVEAFGHQVHVAVGDVQFHLHLRVLLRKARQHGRQPVVAIGGGHAQAHAAGQRTVLGQYVALGVVQQAEGGAHLFQIEPPGVGQAHAAGGPLQQLPAQPRFQTGDRTAQHRGCGGQRHRASGERAVLDHRQEHLHIAQVVELAAHLALRGTDVLRWGQFIAAGAMNKVAAIPR
ncbi:hypothetical protein D3C81_1101340 [compost metagenome]